MAMLFDLKNVTHTPEKPQMKTPFTVKGNIQLIGLTFIPPIWVIATVTYPEIWWEEIIPIIGAPQLREMDMAVGGKFEVLFDRGFDREGEFTLEVRVYAGPTFPIDKLTLPPFPPVASEKTTFIVAGQAAKEAYFRSFKVVSYSKNGGTPVKYPTILALDLGDRCHVNVSGEHRGPVSEGKFHAAIWQRTVIDPHDEILAAELDFSLPKSADWQPFNKSIDIGITSKIAPGSKYGLYAKIMGVDGEIFSDFLESIITIKGMPAQPVLQVVSFSLS